MKVSIIIPAYNEEKTIGKVLTKISRKYETIVVDDASVDDTLNIAKSFGVKVIKHKKNLGYDKAIKTGIENSTGDLIITLDADGEHNPVEISKLIHKLDKENADIVLGERKKLPRFSEKIITWLVRVKVNEIKDATTGFRAMKKRNLKKLNLDNIGFGANLILEAKRRGLNITTVKISPSKRRKKSKMRMSKIIITIIKLICNLILE